MSEREKREVVWDYIIIDDETGERTGISDDAPEDVKSAYAEILAEEKEIDEFWDFAMENITFDENFRPTGVRNGSPSDTMDRYHEFVKKYGAFPPPDDY